MAGGLAIDEEPLEGLAAAGAPPEVLAAFRARLHAQAAQRSVGVFPENWHAVSVFWAMRTQWRVVVGVEDLLWLGLDYGALGPVLEEHRRCLHRQPMERLMPQLRTLEMAARGVLNAES